MKEEFQSLYEVFVKTYFQKGESKEILHENLKTAKKLYADSEKHLLEIADLMEQTGDDFPDLSEAILYIQILVLSDMYLKENTIAVG